MARAKKTTKKTTKKPKAKKTAKENPFEPEDVVGEPVEHCEAHGEPWCEICDPPQEATDEVEELTVKPVKATGKKLRKGKTLAIPGTEEERNPRLDDLAEIYYDVMTERCGLSAREKDAHKELADAMREEKVKTYRWRPNDETEFVLTLKVGKEKVKFNPVRGDE